MQNTPIGKQASKSLHNVSESIRDTGEHLVSDLSQKTSRMADDAMETAENYYHRASNWVQNNYGKTLGIVGAIAAVSTLGYFLSRNSERSEFQSSSRRQQH